MGNTAESGAGRRPLTKRIAAFVAIVSVALLSSVPARANYASLLMDASTGRVLYEANADLPRYPASLTKMMTLYMLFEALDQGRVSLDQGLYTSEHASEQAPTKLGLRPGQRIVVEDAILGLVTKSANDAAAVVAEALGGTEENFAWQMTTRAHQLGMTQTYFANASGLPDPNQITSARDMAILALALLHDYPHYYHYFGTERFYWGGSSLANHNRLLGNYPGVDGIKTGYTHAAGFNLVASAMRDGRRLIGVVMGASSSGTRSLLMTSMLDQAFSGSDITVASLDEPEIPPQPALAPHWTAALAPVSPAAAAEFIPVRTVRQARTTDQTRSKRNERPAVASRSARGKQLASRAPAKAAAKPVAAKAQPKGKGTGIVLASAKSASKAPAAKAAVASRPTKAAAKGNTTAAKGKAPTATAAATKPVAKPAKTAKAVASTPKRRIAENERSARKS